MIEELTQPTKKPNKILVSIFLTVKATVLDTHNIKMDFLMVFFEI